MQTPATLAFCGLCLLCGVAVHLIAEFIGLGWGPGAAHVFSARGTPLGALAAISLLLVAVAARQAHAHAGRGMIRGIVESSPGPAVSAAPLAFLGQLVIFAATELGEGTPLGAGDLALGLVAALIACAIGALLVALYGTRVLRALAGIFVRIRAALLRCALSLGHRANADVAFAECDAIVFAASTRPPPSTLAIAHFHFVRIVGASGCSTTFGRSVVRFPLLQ